MDERRSKHCKQLCGQKLENCEHFCEGVCHFGKGAHMRCQKACTRIAPKCRYHHRCTRRCFEDCGRCETKVQFTCERCSTLHEAPCWQQESFACETLMTGRGACEHNREHRVTAPCHAWKAGTAFKYCTHPCQLPMPCTHICQNNCHEGDDIDHAKQMSLCTEKKSVTHPKCGAHRITVPCNIKLQDFPKCREQCAECAPCSHRCTLPPQVPPHRYTTQV